MYINPNVEVREAVEFSVGVPPQSLAASTVYQSDWTSIQEVRRAIGVGQVENLADTKTLHVYFRQAKDASGTDAKSLGSEVTVTADGEQDVLAVAEVFEQDVDTENGFDYISVAMYHDDSTSDNGSASMGTVPYRRDGSATTTNAVSSGGSDTTASA